jgi:hypothetical protein
MAAMPSCSRAERQTRAPRSDGERIYPATHFYDKGQALSPRPDRVKVNSNNPSVSSNSGVFRD